MGTKYLTLTALWSRWSFNEMDLNSQFGMQPVWIFCVSRAGSDPLTLASSSSAHCRPLLGQQLIVLGSDWSLGPHLLYQVSCLPVGSSTLCHSHISHLSQGSHQWHHLWPLIGQWEPLWASDWLTRLHSESDNTSGPDFSLDSNTKYSWLITLARVRCQTWELEL